MAAPEACEPPQDLVFVDLETTGGNTARDRITEVAIVRVRDGVTIETWSSLVNPECPIPAYIERFTGITDEMVAAAPTFRDVASIVLAKLRGSGTPPPVFAAHNARFDYGFLRAEFCRLSLTFAAPVLCTVKLSRRLFPEHRRHNLDAVMERHGLVCDARHRALGDARVIGEFWRTLLRELPRERLASAAHTLLAGVRLPQQLPAGLADELPDGPGIYRFFGAGEALLYVGRGASIRAGVVGHLGGERGGVRGAELREAVLRVDWEESAGELGAQLRELACVRSAPPLHQPRASGVPASVTIRVDERSSAARIDALAQIPPEALEECFGLFHSARQARRALADIAAARGLCAKVLGLEEASGACLGHRLGHCKGACIGQEPLTLHALRARLALAAMKLKPWPFRGRIALRERRAFDTVELHVLDRWQYLGTARCEQELASLVERSPAAEFDVQIYKILSRHFANHPKLDWFDLESLAQDRGAAMRLIDVS